MKRTLSKSRLGGGFLALVLVPLVWTGVVGNMTEQVMALDSPAACYFVDANAGSNAYSGRFSVPNATFTDGPLKTIQTAYDKLKPGDSLSIKRGVYRETVTLDEKASEASPIVIQAFPGDEGEAVISAADEIHGWQKCPNQASCAGNPNWQHIFYADVGLEVKQLFQGGVRLKRSRYPNAGWLYPTSGDPHDPNKVFFDSSLQGKDGYFVGSTCHIKTAMWQLDQIAVHAYSAGDGKITLESSTRYAISPSFGYYFTNVIGEINEEGEWACDAAQKRVYLWPLRASLDNIEGGWRQYGIDTCAGCSYHIVKGLAVKYAIDDGIRLYKTDHVTIKENTIDYSYSSAIEEYEGSNSSILSNTIRYSNERGITDHDLSACHVITGNMVYATGAENIGDDLIQGVGQGISISGSHAQIINNRVDRSGYTGIYIGGQTSGREIAYNYVTNSCLSLSDGGGIYTGGHSSSTEQDHFHHNIVTDVWGYLGGCAEYRNSYLNSPALCRGEAYGIYLDEEGNNRVFERNTVINGGDVGIFFHWVRDNRLAGNTLYGNARCQILFSGNDDPRFILQGNEVKDNLLIATGPDQMTFQLNVDYNDVHFGDSDDNCFFHPQGEKPIAVLRDLGEGRCTTYSVAEWHNLSGEDSHSKDLSFPVGLDGHQQTPAIFMNPSMQTATIDLSGQDYLNIDGNVISGKVSLGSFESIVLFPRVAADRVVGP